MFGLRPSDIEEILNIIKAYPEISEAIIFGSRAMGHHRKGSDVDIAIKGHHLTELTTHIAGQLNEEAPIPYFFDVINYNSINNANLKDHIDRVGITIYKSH